MSTTSDVDSKGMHYLDSLPRRVFTIYVPIVVFVIVLLFRPRGLIGEVPVVSRHADD